MSAYPIPITFTSLAANSQLTKPFPINGQITGIATSFQGQTVNTNIQFNIILSTISITDGFLNASVFSNIVLPVIVPNWNSILPVSGSGTIIAQNSSSSTAYTFTIVLLVK